MDDGPRSNGREDRASVSPAGDAPARRADAPVRRFVRALLSSRIEQRAHDLTARAQEALLLPMTGWRAASAAATISRQPGDETVSVVTERRKWSYCLQYGPVSAPVTGDYRFELEYRVLEGGVRLGILSGDQSAWLPSESTDAVSLDGRTLTVSTRLRSGQAFCLILYNHHPEGDEQSRLLVRRVAAAVEPDHVLSMIGRAVERVVGAPPHPGVVVMPREPTEYGIDGWRAVDARPSGPLEDLDVSKSVVTSETNGSCCLEYGPIQAAFTGTYRFTLLYDLVEGGMAFGVLNGDRRQWLSFSCQFTNSPEGRTLTTSAHLRAGRSFWLMLSNDHPAGNSPSRFAIAALRSSLEVKLSRAPFSIPRPFMGRGEHTVMAAPKEPTGYSIARWRFVDVMGSVSQAPIEGRLSATTARERWSYCLEFGLLQAAATGTYEFVLTYELAEGGIRLGVLNAKKTRWLPSFSEFMSTASRCTLRLSVYLKAGRMFRLMISNDHPDGDSPSRFAIRGLTSSVDVASWLTRWGRAIRPFTLAPARKVVVAPQESTTYDTDRWRAVSSLRRPIEHLEGAVAAATAKGKWSSCLEYGLMRAAGSGTYAFTLTYEVASGGIVLGALDGPKRNRLTSSLNKATGSDVQTMTLTVPLSAGQLFWIVISNDHPEGERVSRFKVHALTSTFVPINRRELWSPFWQRASA